MSFQQGLGGEPFDTSVAVGPAGVGGSMGLLGYKNHLQIFNLILAGVEFVSVSVTSKPISQS